MLLTSKRLCNGSAPKVGNQTVEPEVKVPSVISENVTINPNEIRYSQSSVNNVQEIIDSMKANGWVGDLIDVVKMPDGNLTTIDNTRVLAAKYAQIDVKATIHVASDSIPADVATRFTTKSGQIPTTWGEAVTNRINNQNSVYRNTYPNGSDIIGWDGN